MRAIALVALALSLLVLPRTVVAQQAAGNTESARRHFSAGVKLYDAKDYPGALEEFRLAYADKPSPGIKRNIALCLKEMRRYPEAIEALEQMLDEAGDSLKPEVREGARKTIDEMLPLVASLRIKVQVHTTTPGLQAPVELWLDDVPLPVERLARSVRVMPGAHTLKARSVGFQEARRAVTVDAGAHDVPVTLDLVSTALAPTGKLTVKATPTDAEIVVDGVSLGQGAWSGPMGAGTHHVEVRAPGYTTFSTVLTFNGGEVQELPVSLSTAPGPPAPPPPPPPKERFWYGLAGMTLQGESLTQSQAVFGDSAKIGQPRGFGGATFTLKLGRKLGRVLMLEMLGEIGAYGVNQYNDPAGKQAHITITNWIVGPELRLHSRGTVRFVGGAGAGIEGQKTDASLSLHTADPGSTEVSGSGTSGMFLLEAGVEFTAGRVLFDISGVADVHGIGSAEDGSGNRLYLSSPAGRLGLRLLVGFEL